MKRAARIIVLVVASVAVLMVGLYFFMLNQTTQASPLDIVSYEENGLDIEIEYSRPQVRGRLIFGGLVPYGSVWRTGANEPTKFSTASDIVVNGNNLPAGEYTIWTIPNQDEWTVIWNSKDYFWGVDMTGEAAREEQYDVVRAKATPLEVMHTDTFTIDIDNGIMSMIWSNTKVELVVKPGNSVE